MGEIERREKRKRLGERVWGREIGVRGVDWGEIESEKDIVKERERWED